MPIEVRGLKEALATLNKLDNKLRRQITKDMRKIAEPALAAIRAEIPTEAPLRGMRHQKRTGWKGNEQGLPRLILNGKKPKVRTRAGMNFVSNVGTIIISANTPKKNEGGRGSAFLIADMAGAGRAGPRNPALARPNLPGALNAKVGRQGSRFMWYGANKALPDVTAALEESSREIIQWANAAIRAQQIGSD